MTPAARSIVDACWQRADESPDAAALVYVSERSGDLRLTRAEVCRRVEACAARLVAAGLAPGDVTLIAVDHGIRQVELLLGALYVGAIPCLFPALAPRLDPAGFAERLAHAAAQLRPRAVVSDRTGKFHSLDAAARVVESDALFDSRSVGDRPVRQAAGGSSLAFVQLSSGSTGHQKAIAISHGAVLGLVAARQRALQMTASDVVVNWAPLYHDLGLIGGVVAPLVSGVPTVLMSPVEWLARPAMQLHAVHRYSATMCTMPNFALGYSACRIRDEEMEGVRLDSWTRLLSGGEPADVATFETFIARFEPYGFDRRALAAAYGLAEHVLSVTIPSFGCEPRIDRVDRRTLQAERLAVPRTGEGSTAIVSCGIPLDGVELQIRSPEGDERGDREVGEIFVRSPFVFSGYLNDPSRTAEVLRDGWLATGDLGYLVEGELFVCGRLKDIIIVGGTNVAAEDVERAASRAAGVKAGRVAAFGAPDPRTGSEMIVVVAERSAVGSGSEAAFADDTIADEIRRLVRRELDVAVGRVDLVPAHWIVKTTSGKNARWASRERWLSERAPGAQDTAPV